MEFKKMVIITLYAKQKETQMYRTDFWTLWEKARVGCSERTALKQVYYQGWNRPDHVGCMRQVLRAGALGWPRQMGWRGRREGGSGWETHVNPLLIHVNVWQKPLQYCKVFSLQLIKINGKKKKTIKKRKWFQHNHYSWSNTMFCYCFTSNSSHYLKKSEMKLVHREFRTSVWNTRHSHIQLTISIVHHPDVCIPELTIRTSVNMLWPQ